jgi:hypothetical protein
MLAMNGGIETVVLEELDLVIEILEDKTLLEVTAA